MTGPREWRHAKDCGVRCPIPRCPLHRGGCDCGLSAVRDAIAAGHRVVIGPDGVEGRLVADRGWQTTIASDGDPMLSVRDDLYRLVPIEEATDVLPPPLWSLDPDEWRTVPDGWEVCFDHNCEGTCWENVPASACPDRKPFLVPVSPSVDPEEEP